MCRSDSIGSLQSEVMRMSWAASRYPKAVSSAPTRPIAPPSWSRITMVKGEDTRAKWSMIVSMASSLSSWTKLHLQVGHGADKIGNRWTNPPQRLHDRFSHVDGAVVAEMDGGHGCAIRRRPQATGRSKFIRGRLGDLMEDVENLTCLSKRKDQPACQHGSNRVKTEFEGGGDPEVGASASHSPEEVWVLLGTDRHEVAFSRDQIDGEEVITGQTVLSHQPAESATEGKSSDAGRGDQAPRGCQAEDAGLTVKLAPRHPSLSPNGAPRRIDANTFHGGEINDHAAVYKRSPRNIVATAANSQEDAMRAGKVDGIDDVGNSGTLNDQCRVFVDERVVVPSGHIVVRITRTQYPATQTTFKFLDDHVVQVRRFHQLHDAAPFSP